MISSSYTTRKIWTILSLIPMLLTLVTGPPSPSHALSPSPFNLSVLPPWARTERDDTAQSQADAYLVHHDTRDRPSASAAHSDVRENQPGAAYLGMAQPREDVVSLKARDYLLGPDAEHGRARPLGPPGYPCYRDVNQLYAVLQQISTDYPDLTELIDYGDSWCKENPNECSDNETGYDLWVLKITNPRIGVPKPRFFLMANIHARELVTPETALYFTEYLVDNYGTDPDTTWIVDYHEVYVIITANPDGRQLVEGGCRQRKNRNNSEGDCTVCDTEGSSHYGVDLNRNFPYHWVQSTTDACAWMYPGSSAASEAETFYLMDLVRSLFPDQRAADDVSPAPDDTTGLLISLHSYGNLVLWPWAWKYGDAPNASQLRTLGRKFAHFNNYTPQQSSDFYIATGDTTDWAYGELGIPAYTFEMGEDHFQPCGDLQQIMDENLGALLYAAKVPRTPYLTPSGPDSLNLAVAPITVTVGETARLTATIDDTRYNNSNGMEPTQSVTGAEYYVDIPPWITTTTPISHPMTAVDGSFDETVEVVTATVDTTGLSRGQHTLFVRGRDANGNWGPFSAVFLFFDAPTLTTMIVTPTLVTVTVGATQTFTAAGYDQFSDPIPVTPTWTTNAGTATLTPGVTTVLTVQTWSASGRLITATQGSVSGTAVLNIVHGSATAIELTPAPTIITAGESLSYTVTARDTYSNAWDVTAVSTYSITRAAGGIWAGNVYTAGMAGTWTVSATYLGLTDTAVLTVTHAPMATGVTLDPAQHVVEAGGQVAYTLIATDPYGNPWDVTASGHYTIAPVAGGTWMSNVYTAEVAGSWTVTATYLGLIDAAILTVTHAPVAATAAFSPIKHRVEAGREVSYTLIATDTYGNSWDASVDATYAITPAAGGTWTNNVYTAEVAGTWTVTAIYPGLSETAVLTVTHAPTATGVNLSPARHTVAAGAPVVYMLTATDAYGNPWDVTVTGSYTTAPAAGGTWTSNVYTAEVAGSWTVTATHAGLNGTAVLTVTHAPTAVTATLSPNPHKIGAGGKVAYTLITSDMYGNSWDATADGNYTITPAAGGAWMGNIYTSQYTGTWTVTGTVPNAAASAVLSVTQLPAASFIHAPTGAACIGTTIQFTDTSSGNPTAWAWDFGDGGIAHRQHPTHTYANTGSFTVTLATTNPYGSDVATGTVHIISEPSVAISHTPAGQACKGAQAAFSAINGGGPASYVWSFGDGVTATGQHVNHAYAAAGMYTVWLTATNDCAIDIVSTTVTVVPNPSASFVRHPAGDVSTHTIVHFTDTSNGEPTRWLWDFGDGATSNLQHPGHTYTITGAFTVSLTITQACGSDTASGTVVVKSPPVLQPTYLPLVMRQHTHTLHLPPSPTMGAYTAEMEIARQGTSTPRILYSTIPTLGCGPGSGLLHLRRTWHQPTDARRRDASDSG